MITKNLFAGILSAGLLTVASCSTDIDTPGGASAPVAARVTASIGAVQSRAAGTSWGKDDPIGISATGGNGAYANVKYVTTDGSGSFTPANGPGILLQSPEEVTFTAYYPYHANGGTIEAATADQREQQDFDFLYAEGAKASIANSTLSFTGSHAFKHMMTRLVLHIRADEASGVRPADIATGTYRISGISHSGTFNTATGEAAAAGDVTPDWVITAAPVDADGVRSYDMILFPQSAVPLTFKAVIGSQAYEAQLSPELAAGHVYTYTVTVRNTGLSVSGCTIQDWSNGADYSGETEVVMPPIGDKVKEDAAVGDYYFSDGSFADKNAELTTEQAKACIGIVFHRGSYPDDGSDYSDSGINQQKCNGYVVALTDVGELEWSTKDFTATGVSTSDKDWNGYSNQKKLEERGIDNYPAAKGCKDYGTESGSRFAAPTGSSGWFLPSAGQLKHLHDNEANISGQMDKCRNRSGDSNIGWFSTDWYYWSSSELSDRNAWYVYFYYGRVYDGSEDDTYDVRAVLAF